VNTDGKKCGGFRNHVSRLRLSGIPKVVIPQFFPPVIQTKLISPPDQVNIGDLWSNKALALAGLLLTVIWLFVSCSSAYWIRRWRREVKTISEYLSDIRSYKNVEVVGRWTDLLRPEHITILLPLLFLGLWAFALFKVLC
jgi:hypothetical protein